jgi:hypothetical protein
MTTNPMTETHARSSTDPLAGSSGGGVKDQAKETAQTASQEAKNVAREVGDQTRNLMEEARTQVQDQSRTQRDRLVEMLRSFTDDLEQMSQDRDGMAAQAARQVAGQARTLEQRIDGREPSDLLEEVRSFARRRPGAFLAGAAVAGVVVGRMLRGAKDASSSNGAGWSGSTDPTASAGLPPTTGYPPVGAPPLTSYDDRPVTTGASTGGLVSETDVPGSPSMTGPSGLPGIGEPDDGRPTGAPR